MKKYNSVVFLIIGALVAIISFLIKPEGSQDREFWSDAVLNLALVLIAVTLLDWLWHLAGGEPLSQSVSELKTNLDLFNSRVQASTQLLADGNATGLQRLVLRSSDLITPEGWMKRLGSAKEKVDLMGYTLHVWTKGADFEGEVLRLVHEKQARVRMLVMDKNNPLFTSFINPDKFTVAFSRAELDEVEACANRMSQKALESRSKGSFEFRTVRTGVIPCQICRTDDEMTLIPYLYSVIASLSPLLLIRGGQTSRLFVTFANEFEELWRLNRPPQLTPAQVKPEAKPSNQGPQEDGSTAA